MYSVYLCASQWVGEYLFTCYVLCRGLHVSKGLAHTYLAQY